MHRIVVIALAVSILVVLAADGAPAHRPVTAPTLAQQAPKAVHIGSLPPSFPLEIGLVLRGQRPDDLSALLAAEDDPQSPLYHRYLSSTTFAQLYGPSAEDEAHAAQVLRTAGFQIENNSTSGSLLMAQGTAGAVEKLFDVSLDQYRAPQGTLYYLARSEAHIPTTLVASVSGVLGLDSRSQIETHPLLARRASQSAPVTGLEPADLAKAYDIAPLWAQGLDGSNQTIAVPAIDTFSTRDIATYDNAFGIDAPPVQVISVGRGARGNDAEATLDIEVLHAVAPHAHILVYEGGQSGSQLAQVFNRMVTDHRAQIISISLGTCEGQISGPDGQGFVNALNSTFKQADAEGISVLVASGDSGAYDCQSQALSADLPSAIPYVTAVGGTTLYLNSDGSYSHEAGWEGPLESAGTGGGLSQLYTRPTWQSGPGVSNSDSNGMRQVPDVAADADPLSGYYIYFSGWQIIGGTSAAAPLWAGLSALADQAAAASHKPPLGLLNPALYALGNSALSPSPFHDVTIGGNLYYQSTPGWDYATGWGSPDAAVLVPALVGQP